MKFILEPYNHNVKDKELLSDLKRVAKELGKNKVSRDDYERLGKYSAGLVRTRFITWNRAIEMAGLKPVMYKGLSPKQLFDNFEDIWMREKRQPRPSDIKNGNSRYSITPYIRAFGSWRKALVAFVEYINNGRVITIPKAKRRSKHDASVRRKARSRKNVPKRLRYMVLERDCYKCRVCGRSPASEPGVKLHIDHVIPWSKGGETLAENLQTLCAECNIGKSNL
jgi:5-methylcytosine-specific restriction endonuclease McrA